MLKPQFYANRETEKTGELFSFSPDTFIGSVQQIKRFICHVVVAQNAMDLVAMHVEDLHRQLEMVNVSIINQQQCFSKSGSFILQRLTETVYRSKLTTKGEWERISEGRGSRNVTPDGQRRKGDQVALKIGSWN